MYYIERSMGKAQLPAPREVYLARGYLYKGDICP